MIFLIYGEENFLMEKQLASIKKKLDCKEELLNFSTYHLDIDDLEDVIQDLATPSFLAKNKLVLLKNPEFLTGKKLKREINLDKFARCLDLSDDDNHLVLYLNAPKLDERKKLVKELKERAKIYKFNHLTDQKLADSYRQSIRARQATITDPALDLLLARHKGGLHDALGAVEKLTLYTKTIDVDDVNLVVEKPLEENIFELQGAILKKDRLLMMRLYQDLMVLNEEPIKLIVLLANALRLLYEVTLLDRKGYNDGEIAKMLKINRFRLKYIRQDSQAFELAKIQELLNDLANLDYQIKTGRIDKKLGFELFLLKI